MTKIVLIYHSTQLHGPIDLLGTYYEEFGNSLATINNPLDDYTNRRTILIDENIEKLSIARRANKFNLFYDFLLVQKCLNKIGSNSFVAIGANNFDTLAAIFYKKVLRKKKCKRIIYFASDFSKTRFKNKILNYVYLLVERLAIKHSDITVSNTKRAEVERLKLGLTKDKSVVIPNAVKLNITSPLTKNINKRNFIYVGNVTAEHGLQDILHKISHSIDHLTVIGDGSVWDSLVELCKSLKIATEFHRNKPHEFVIDYLLKFNGFGLAPYNDSAEWTYFCSPLKVSEYVSCSVPVIMSSVPEIAQIVSERKLGIVYNDSQQANIPALIEEFDLSNFGTKSFEFYESFNYKHLYERLKL